MPLGIIPTNWSPIHSSMPNCHPSEKLQIHLSILHGEQGTYRYEYADNGRQNIENISSQSLGLMLIQSMLKTA